MTDQEMSIIMRDALKLACKFIRDNPPGDLERYPDPDYILACACASKDPEGKRWMNLFIRKATEKRIRNEKTDTVG